MADENLDVKGTTEGTEQPQPSAEASTAKTDVQTDAEGTKPTLESVIAEVVEKSQSSSDKAAEEGDVQKLNKTQEGDKAEGEKKVAEQPDAEKGKGEEDKGDKKQDEVKEGEPVPYERFKENNDELVALKGEMEQVRPLLEAQKSVIEFCRENQVSSDEFRYWMNLAAMAKNDPAKALEALKPKLEEMQSFTGDKLPEDLAKAVENGEVSMAVAKRLVAAENKLKYGERQVQKSQEELLAERQQQETTRMTGVFNSWVQAQAKGDPDFQPKKAPNAPDGKFELFLYRFKSDADNALRSGKLKNENDMIAIAQESYKAITSTVSSMLPKPGNTKTVLSTRSSATPKSGPKTFEEVVAGAAAKHGIDFVPTK